MNCAVDIRNLSFEYTKFQGEGIGVKNVSLQAYTSHILALVGPSGCGKTTLVKLIISLLTPQHGKLILFGHEYSMESHDGQYRIGVPGPNVGYMPQDEAIPMDMRVSECLHFFGALNQMESDYIRQRIGVVLEKLDLESKRNSLISTLSGGMRRRLSLAVAILHSPQLLILDEPTVGCDPPLRHKIWSLLNEMRDGNVCIIISTHYIEECSQADRICFMRRGQIVVTKSPEEIKSSTQTDNLDDAFYELCSRQQQSNDSSSSRNVNQKQSSKQNDHPDNQNLIYSIPRPVNNRLHARIRIIFWLFYRYCHLFAFTPIAMIMVFALPTAHVFTAHILLGTKVQDVPFGMCIENQTIFDDVKLLSEKNIHPKCLECLNPSHYPEFIRPNVFHFTHYDHIDDALADVQANKILGVVYINANFGDAFLRNLALDRSDLDIGTIRNSKITIYADTTNRHLQYAMELFLSQAYRDYWEASKANLSLKSLPVHPIKYENSVIDGRKVDEPTNDWYKVGSSIGSSVTAAMIIAGLSIIAEINNKCVQRYIASGVKNFDIFSAQILTNTIILSFPAFLGLLSTLYLLDSQVKGSLFLVYLLIFLLIINAVLTGVFLGVAWMSEVILILCAIFIELAICFNQGGVIPTDGYPYYIKPLSDLLPHTKPINALRSLVLYGQPLSSPFVYEGFITIIIHNLIFLCITYHFIGKRLGILRK
ncbi:ABC transporter G family member 20-like [Brevipalpus obovatus]|uniref:ABC transporter G family member 20-like n=1 Tax=Brevipalpus obovatus TaxID=246614 RepID=UPI003D9E97DD